MTSSPEPELRAEAVLRAIPSWLWDGERLPIPVEEIADTHFGLLVRDVDDLGTAPGAPHLPPDHGLSGLLLAARGEIWVSRPEAESWPPRRRFTIGHELGHWELHRTGQTSLFCRTSVVLEDPLQVAAIPPRPPLPPAEEEANAFAAALLMPDHLVRGERIRCGADVIALCRRFGTSKAAMIKRVEQVLGEALDPQVGQLP